MLADPHGYILNPGHVSRQMMTCHRPEPHLCTALTSQGSGSSGSKFVEFSVCCLQVGSGIIYVSASQKGGDFGSRLAEALQLGEKLPNPVRLLYDYALQLSHGVTPASDLRSLCRIGESSNDVICELSAMSGVS